MAGLIALTGRDVIAALIAGGFRVARRERGLALLVRDARDAEVVVVPENGVLQRPRILALLERAGIEERQLVSWLSIAHAPARPAATRSGFQRKVTPGEERSLDDVVKRVMDVSARAGAAHDGAQVALAASREVLERLPPTTDPDATRLTAVQESLARWHEALREVEEEEARERLRKKR